MVNGFTKKKVGTLTLGEKLKKLRSDKRMSLNEVSRSTKIRLEYLGYLEEGRYDELPADVYVRGFLKSYGDFLNVDEQCLIRLYEKEKGIKRNIEKGRCSEEVQKIKPLNISPFVFTPGKMAFLGVTVLVLFSLFYLYRQAVSLTDVPRLVIFSPSQNMEVEGDMLSLEGKTDKNALIFVNNQRVLVDDNGNFQENIHLQVGINVISIRALNQFQKEAKEDITVQANYQEAQDVSGSGSDFLEAKNELFPNQAILLELKVDPGPVWISVEADGNVVYSGTVLFGVTQTFSAKDKLVVSSGRANATFVKLGGKDWEALGQEEGALKGVIFDQNGRSLNK